MRLNLRIQSKYKLNILCILDDFSSQMLAYEPGVSIDHASPHSMPFFFKTYDLLLVESAWLAHKNRWKYQIASYPDQPDRNHNNLIKLIEWAKQKNIPTVFWNKEDPFHFSQFIETAKLFDYIFTTDASLIPAYQRECPDAKVAALSFPFQPKIHYPKPVEQIATRSSVFIGSYIRHMHTERQQWQDMCFNAAAPFGLTVVDRHAHFKKKLVNYQFPNIHNIEYHNAVAYTKTAAYYHRHQQAINVNTVTDSPTMYSRRLIEIMACHRLAISNPSKAIDRLFPDLCECVDNSEQAEALFQQLQFGYTAQQLEKVKAAREHVFQHYTVHHWLKNLLNFCNIDHPYLDRT